MRILLLLIFALAACNAHAQWTTRAAAPTARWGPAACALGGKIYLFGGNNGADTGVNQCYDPATNTWTTLAAMPTARTYPAAVGAANGKIYVFGGAAGSTWLYTVQEYDPATNTWANKTNMPVNSMGLGAAEAGGRIYVVGGWNGVLLNNNQEYNYTTDTWTARATMPVARYQISAAALGGLVYGVGGYTSAPVGTTEAYDPVANTWTTRASLNTGRYLHGVAAQGGYVWAMGGFPNTGTTERYNPGTNTWAYQSNLNQARYRIAGAATSDCVYALAGFTGSVTVGTNEETCSIVLDENTFNAQAELSEFGLKISWQDAQPFASRYEIEEWMYHTAWLPVGGIPARTAQSQYEMMLPPVNRETLFRVRREDENGDFSWSEVVRAAPVSQQRPLLIYEFIPGELFLAEFQGEGNEPYSIRIQDPTGRVVYASDEKQSLPGLNHVNIPVSGLASGVYISTLKVGAKNMTERFVKP